MIYICKKICNKCGQYYICKTEQDPKCYLGSGTDWKKHNKECSRNHTTEILFSGNIKETREFCNQYEVHNPYYWKDEDCINMIKEGGGYSLSGKSNPNFKHGKSVDWKSNPEVQKENDKERNEKYHNENRELENSRMNFSYNRKQNKKIKAYIYWTNWLELRKNNNGGAVIKEEDFELFWKYGIKEAEEILKKEQSTLESFF